MPSLSSIFHHKSHSNAAHEVDAGAKKTEAKAPPQQSAPPPYAETQQPTTQTAANLNRPQQVALQFAPGTGPAARGQMAQANNIGMMVGGADLGRTGRRKHGDAADPAGTETPILQRASFEV